MIVGLDFDNTIACYDSAIQILADQMFDLPVSVPRTKLGLRNHLRSVRRESDWTLFQGSLYGPGMLYATPFPGVIEAIRTLRLLGHRPVVISHRTRFPYAGEKHDLHAAAREWLQLNFQGANEELISKTDIYFLETRQQKIEKIVEQRCELFIDDLPEVLGDEGFPPSTQAILFDPDRTTGSVPSSWHVLNHWQDLPELFQSNVR
jgi:hypothetical protein